MADFLHVKERGQRLTRVALAARVGGVDVRHKIRSSACRVGLESLSLPSGLPAVLAVASALAMGLGSLMSTLEEKRMLSTLLHGLPSSICGTWNNEKGRPTNRTAL